MLEMLKPGLVDFACGSLALAWALVCLPLPALEAYCSGVVAFGFAMAAYTRALVSVRAALPASED